MKETVPFRQLQPPGKTYSQMSAGDVAEGPDDCNQV